MFWTGFWFAAGAAGFLVLCRLLLAGFDALDAWTNRITPEEAQRRAQLAKSGRWPPKEPRLLTVGEAMLAAVFITGLVLLRHYLR